MREPEHEEAAALRRRPEEVDATAAPELRGHAHLRPGPARGQAHPHARPQDCAQRRLHHSADQDDGLPSLPAATRYPSLLRALSQRDEGLSSPSYRAHRQLGQIYR